MLAAISVPSPQEENIQRDEEKAHEALILSSTQFSDLVVEPLSDVGLARLVKLVAQIGHELDATIEARKASTV